jgi:SAM-dependent methyltransferase
MKFHSNEAAARGEPSYVWREGQQRRLKMMLSALPLHSGSRVLVDGCGLGLYVHELSKFYKSVHGLDIEISRLASSVVDRELLVAGQCENLPYAEGSFDYVISHEVLEHVQDDIMAAREIVRVLRLPDRDKGVFGGRAIIFVPNRWYPVETHGIYWLDKYRFGNVPLINYLPNVLRDSLVPHVRAYTSSEIRNMFTGLQAHIVSHTVIFGGYDNLISKWNIIGKMIRNGLQALENTSLRWIGLSHIIVIEKNLPDLCD